MGDPRIKSTGVRFKCYWVSNGEPRSGSHILAVIPDLIQDPEFGEKPGSRIKPGMTAELEAAHIDDHPTIDWRGGWFDPMPMHISAT